MREERVKSLAKLGEKGYNREVTPGVHQSDKTAGAAAPR